MMPHEIPRTTHHHQHIQDQGSGGHEHIMTSAPHIYRDRNSARVFHFHIQGYMYGHHIGSYSTTRSSDSRSVPGFM